MSEEEAALLFTLIPGVKSKIIQPVLATFGSFANYFCDQGSAAPAVLLAPRELYFQHRRGLDEKVAAAMEYLHLQDISLVVLGSDAYPLLLAEIHSPPVVLYVKGNKDLLALPQIAIVGSRRASRWGISQAESFAVALAAGGFTITSGLALGVDGAAHRGAIKAGKTIAVLGSGVDKVYPRQHEGLYRDIVTTGGAVISEFPPGSPPLRHHFPQRNRIISGLSLGILIVEAAAKSGSLITARMAMEQGREVFAIPGSIHNPAARGCHQLIREGATLTETLDDIVGQLGGMLSLKAAESGLGGDSTPEKQVPENRLEKNVLQAMGYEAVDLDTLQELLGIATPELTVALVNLEIQGFIDNVGGGYQRIK